MAQHVITLTEAQETRIAAYLAYANRQTPPPGFPTPPPLVGVQGFIEQAIGVMESAANWQQQQQGAS